MTRCSLVTDINKIYLGFTIAAFQLERRTTKVSFREDPYWLEELDKNLHRSTENKKEYVWPGDIWNSSYYARL